MNENKKLELSEIRFVKRISVGNINPNNLLSEEALETQIKFLNRCLNDYPKGYIIAKDIAIGRFKLGEHDLTMERTTYHLGFVRKPDWLSD